jgi:RHS repeat-associated protein
LGDVYQGSLKNNYLYQGAYAELDEDIGWTDFALRNYDAQIGRWVQQDPYQQFASPYVGIGNDPINFTDPSGGFIGGLPCPGTSALAIFFDNLSYALTKAAPALSKISIALSITKTAFIVNNTVRTANMINGQLATMQAGGVDPNERLRTLASIAFWEGGSGYDFRTINNFVEIAQIYINREKRGDGTGGGSSFYLNAKNGRSPEKQRFRQSMKILGSPTYAKDKSDAGLVDWQKDILKAIYNALLDPNANKDLPAVQNVNLTRQGFEGDLNGTSAGTLKIYKEWNWIRWYVYYVWAGGIANTNSVRIFNDEIDPSGSSNRHTTFLIDEIEVNKFKRAYAEYEGNEAPKWDVNTNSFLPSTGGGALKFVPKK